MELNWPAAVLIFGLVFLLVFYRPIVRLIDRIKKVGREGIETETKSHELQAEPKQSPVEELLKAFDNQMLLEQEGLIRKDLDSRRITEPAGRERILIRFLAAFQIYAHFQRVYSLIWGSQISALQSLNAAAPDGLPRESIEPFYHWAATIGPGLYENYSFDQWVAFLSSSQLILLENDRLRITTAGREFLKWVIDNGLSTTKSG